MHASLFRMRSILRVALAYTVLFASCFYDLGAHGQTSALVLSVVQGSGSTLLLTGSGGLAGDNYVVLSSTNLLLPPNLWTRISTNIFAMDGTFTSNLPIDFSAPQSFFLVTTVSRSLHLVAAYSFDENSGTTVTDLSGNGNVGTISGATWSSEGVYGSALTFDGSSALVTINNSASLQMNAAMTLEAWISPSVLDSTWRDVIYKGDDNYYLEGTSTSGNAPGAGGTFDGADVTVTGTDALKVNTWSHLAATYDGSTLDLYVNGVQVGSLAQTGTIGASSSPLQIGGDSIYGQYFQGMIDEVRVYNLALTATQIQADMNEPLGKIPSPPGNLTANVISGTQINLSWTDSTDNLGITGYLVERCQGPGCASFTQVGTVSGTNYSDTGLTANRTYNYRVRAMDSSGNLGPYSQVVQVYNGLSVSPHAVALTFTGTQQFTVNMGTVTWSVDGLAGGSGSVGTITSGGLYTPPSTVGVHTVTATTTDQTQTGSATVYVTGSAGVFTYHNDLLRSGQNLNETVLSPANVNSGMFGKLFAYTLDGLTLASPVYVANVNIPGQGFHNMVYVATEHDSVYAFDADGLSNAPLWQVSFINPAGGVTTVPAEDTGETDDIPDEIGITSTPVIDPSSGTLYTVGKTKEVSGSNTNYVQRLHALDITTGAEKFGGPVVIQATQPVIFDPLPENQRTALQLANGVVYFGFSSHGDNPTFYGWVMGYDASSLQQVMVFNTAPNATEAGVWMDGDGPAVDATGNIFFISANGGFDADTGGSDFGDSYLKISPSGDVLDYFSPSVQSFLDVNDLDLGSGGVLLLPDQAGTNVHEMVSAGKNGTIYLVDRDNMGQYNMTSDQIVESIVNIFTNVTGIEGGNFSSPVYYNGNVYFGPVSDNIQAFQLSDGLLSNTPTSRTLDSYDQRGATMAISANGGTNGILWSLQSNGTLAAGILHAYDPGNLANELYNSSQAGSRDTLDAWWKFTVPVVVNGKVFVTSVNQLTVYGLLP